MIADCGLRIADFMVRGLCWVPQFAESRKRRSSNVFDLRSSSPAPLRAIRLPRRAARGNNPAIFLPAGRSAIRNPQSAIRNLHAAKGRAGVVLLEVVLAMSLFFASAMVILAGLSSSLSGMQRVQLEARAQDLAVTALSEVQMGLVPLASDGPTEYEDAALAGWTRQIVVEPYQEQQLGLKLPAFQRVEVTIRYQPTGYATSLTILMPEEPPAVDGMGTGS